MAKSKKTLVPKEAGISQKDKVVIADILESGKIDGKLSRKDLGRDEIELFSRYKRMVLAGFTQQEIMSTLGINQELYFKMIKMIPEELRDEWRAAKILSVENSLYMSCQGFSKTTYKDVVDKEGITHTVAEEKYFPPNVNAIKYYLNNTSSTDWKDRSELVVNGIENMPMSELETKVRAILQAKKDRKIENKKRIELNKQGVPIDSKEESNKEKGS